MGLLNTKTRNRQPVPNYELVSNWLKKSIPYIQFNTRRWSDYVNKRDKFATLPRCPYHLVHTPNITYENKGWKNWDEFNGFHPSNDRTLEFVNKTRKKWDDDDPRRVKKTGSNNPPPPKVDKPKQSSTQIVEQLKGSFDMNLFKDGDKKQFEVIFREFYMPIFYYCRKYTEDDGIADDVTSSVMTKAWIGRHKYESVSHIKSSLYGMAKNECANLFHDNKLKEKHRKYVLHTESEIEEEVENYDVIQAELLGRIQREIELLPSRTREAIYLLFIKGLNSTEAAKKMNVTRKTALNLKLKGIELIKDGLKGICRNPHLISISYDQVIETIKENKIRSLEQYQRKRKGLGLPSPSWMYDQNKEWRRAFKKI